MPHSSGGGSHGGGSHGGGGRSHSSGGGSRGGGSGSSSHIRKTPYTGSKRYVYYHHKKPVFVYSDRDIKKDASSPAVLVISLLIMIFPFLFVGPLGIYASIEHPKPLGILYHPDAVIEDRLGILEDEEGLEDSMQDFFDETGIMPAVITIPNSEWQGGSLTDYAFDEYVDHFRDEAHWLIVYSESVDESGYNDWYFEGMQGNNTDSLLTSEKAMVFNEALQARLEDSEHNTVCSALTDTFDEFKVELMKTSINKPLFFTVTGVCGVMMLLMIALWAKIMKPGESLSMRKAKECDPMFTDQEPCDHCGGIYVIGIHTSCPHCGAPVKPHDFYTDEEGRVTHIVN